MQGRKPKPTALKKLAGNPGHRAPNYAEPQPRVMLPRPPAHLSDDEKAKWSVEMEKVQTVIPDEVITALSARLTEMVVAAIKKEIPLSLMSIGITNITPDSVLVITAPSELSEQAYSSLYKCVETAFPGVKCILLEGGLTIGVIGKTDAVDNTAIHVPFPFPEVREAEGG